jgi:hypothetical protein
MAEGRKLACDSWDTSDESDVPVDDLEFPSSPPSIAMELELGMDVLQDFDFDQDSFVFSEADFMSYGSTEFTGELASPEFRIEVQRPAATPLVHAVHKREDKLPMIFRPFASVESIELTVQGLKKCVSRQMMGSKSLPLPLVADRVSASVSI